MKLSGVRAAKTGVLIITNSCAVSPGPVSDSATPRTEGALSGEAGLPPPCENRASTLERALACSVAAVVKGVALPLAMNSPAAQKPRAWLRRNPGRAPNTPSRLLTSCSAVEAAGAAVCAWAPPSVPMIAVARMAKVAPRAIRRGVLGCMLRDLLNG